MPEDLNIEKELLDNTRWIYKGASNMLTRAIAMENYLRDFCSSPNPFVAPATEPTTLDVMNSSLPARPGKKSNGSWHEPYKKTHPASQPKQSETSRDKFVEISAPHFLPTPEFWIQALAGIDRTKKPNKGVVINSGYIFPDPSLFTSSDGDKLQRLVQTWLNFHIMLITRLIM
ncbi:hypothetical protein VNI00_018462 [Paramarasmius palmivorus]|uniref:Uncharacterized protein n=1 Tax=Paramarasmius palmivorus TaxID=297713 RepID=A0AAW0AXI2_9AGAR